MPLSDRLSLIIDANVGGAIRGFNQVGSAAERELGKATTSMEKLSSRLRTVGAGMVTFGAVALLGLGKAAQASEEADLAVLRLQNSLSNNPRLAGESTAAFLDLADALSKKTVADDDAIVSGMAMLGTFQVTGAQLREITPLVVDYARKFGVDLVSANIAVGKAINGQIGALQRQGVSIDATAFATDHYGAVMQGLREQVGGFAEAEGKTFSGQLAILKNQLGELAEGVGSGAVDAFSNMFGVVAKVTGALESMAPGTQNAIGQFATYGATVLTVGGGLALLVGYLGKARDAMARFAIATKLAWFDVNAGTAIATKAGVALGILAAAAVAVGAAYWGMTHDVNISVDSMKASRTSTADLVTEYNTLTASTGSLVGIMRDGYVKLAQESLGTVIRLRDALKAQGVATTDLDAIIAEETATQKQANADTAAASDATAELTGETEQYTRAAGAVTAHLKLLADAQDRATQSYLDANRAVTDATTGQLDYEESVDRARQAILDAAAATDDRATPAINEMTVANRDAERAVIDMGQAAFDSYIQAGSSAAQAAAGQIASLQAVAATANGPLRAALDAYIAKLQYLQGLHIDTYLTAHYNVTGGGGTGGSGYIPGAPGPQAEGGVYHSNTPQMAVWGEAGGETAIFIPDKYMSGGGRGAAMSGGWGGGDTYNITVTGNVGLNENALALMTKDAILKLARDGHKLPQARALLG